MEPPHGSDTGVPTEPVPRVDVTPPRRPDGTGDRPAGTSGPSGSSGTSGTSGSGTGTNGPDGARAWLAGTRHSRRRTALLVVALLIVAGVVVGIVDPFAKPTAPTTSKSYSTYTISRQSLASQTEVTATLGFVGSYTVTVPSGTSAQSVMQDEAAVTSAESKVKSAESPATAAATAAAVTNAEQSLAEGRATLQTAQSTLRGAQATLAAEQKKEANDCAGSGSTSTTCASDEQQVATDGQTTTSDSQVVVQDKEKVTQDESALSQARTKQSQDATAAQSNLSSAEQTLANAKAALSAAEEQATIQGGAFSELPAVGQVVTEGETLYTVGTTPVVLLYGTTPATRNLYQGESGPDVAELNKDLRALGYGAPDGDTFTATTASAVDDFQAHIGVPETGNLALGQVVFLPTAARVTKVTGVLGSGAQPGSTVVTASSTSREVAIDLDADLQSDVKIGDPVTITLPDQSTTPGVVSYVGTVATIPSDNGDNNTHGSTPTITVDVTPSDPSAIGNLDQAPVTVSITNASVSNVMVVPVDALLALASGGYALEVVPAHGPHYLVPVSTGLFDDENGLVQVTGSEIRVGMRVVVPST